MSLHFLGGDTGDGGSPRLYQEGDDFLVQGYTVTEPQLLAELNIPDGETVVRVPQSLWKYLPTRRGTQEGRGEQMPVHCEMRDLYAEEEEEEEAAWQAEMSDPAGPEAYRRHWLGVMSATAGRMAAVRAGRTLTGPDTEETRFAEAPMSSRIAPAEQVRRLLCRGTSAPMMPVTDLTVIDGTTKLVNHFSSDGTWVESVMIDGSALARQSSWAFNAAWALSAPHGRRDPA